MNGHRHDHDCVGVEASGVYDGILWWMCSDGLGRPRFTDPEDRRSMIAEQYAAAFNAGRDWHEPAQETPGGPVTGQEPGDAQSLDPGSYRRVRGHYGPLEGSGGTVRRPEPDPPPEPDGPPHETQTPIVITYTDPVGCRCTPTLRRKP